MLSNKLDFDSYNSSIISPACLQSPKNEQENNNSEIVKSPSCCCHPASMSPKSTKVDYIEREVSHSNINNLKDEFDSYPCEDYEYIRTKVFPILLNGIKDLLFAVKDKNVLERKRSSFNACDFLTEYLYKNNSNHTDRNHVSLWDISFVKKIHSTKPRPPLPLSLQWTDEEAAIVLQSAWRGYVARCDPEIQELRQYQKEMCEEAYDINFKIEEFWKKHPIDADSQSDNNEIYNT